MRGLHVNLAVCFRANLKSSTWNSNLTALQQQQQQQQKTQLSLLCKYVFNLILSECNKMCITFYLKNKFTSSMPCNK